MLRYALTALAALFTATPCAARTWHILPDGTGDAPTIQEAIYLSENGDVIELADGVFAGSGNVWIEFEGREVTVRSESGDATACRLQGGSFAFEAYSGEGPATRIENLSLVGQSYRGIHIQNSSMTIVGCLIRDGDGEGIYVRNSPSTTITDCAIVNNGNLGVTIFGSNVPITNTLIASNLAGVRTETSLLTMTRCTVSHNTLQGVTGVSGNTILGRCLIAFNGSSVACLNPTSTTCCDIFGNNTGDWVSCIASQANESANFSADPLFCDPDNGDFTIQSASPCAPPGVTGCGSVGALPVGCGPVTVEPLSWGKMKGAYR